MAQFGQRAGMHPRGDRLAVDQHAVAVEDDQVGRSRHLHRQLPDTGEMAASGSAMTISTPQLRARSRSLAGGSASANSAARSGKPQKRTVAVRSNLLRSAATR